MEYSLIIHKNKKLKPGHRTPFSWTRMNIILWQYELGILCKLVKHNIYILLQDSRTPWREILTTVPVYAMVIASIVEMWGYWTLLAEMPNYLSSVLNLDMKEVRTKTSPFTLTLHSGHFKKWPVLLQTSSIEEALGHDSLDSSE